MNMVDKNKSTPVMKQFWSVKEQHQDCIILFRMGDFYETFEKDARITSKILGIALTKRANGAAASVALAGFPYHSLDQYLYKLLKAGYKVAICEQVEDASQAKGIVKREVVEVVSHGTTISDKFLDHNHNNYICSAYYDRTSIGISLLDYSTGEFYTNQIESNSFDNFISQYNISEFLVLESQKELFEKFKSTKEIFTNRIADWLNEFNYNNEILCNHFNVKSMKGFGLNNKSSCIISSGMIIYYLNENFNHGACHINNLKSLSYNNKMQLDYYTTRNLELFESLLNHNKKKGTLLSTINKTVTSSGSRLLKNWITSPLIDKKLINKRLDVIEEFIHDYNFMDYTRNELKKTYDIKRIISKIACKKVNPIDIINLSESLIFLNSFKENIPINKKEIIELINKICKTDKIIKLISNTLKDNPPINMKKGNFIRDGFSNDLDELRIISNDGNDWMLNYQQKLKEETNISSLKIRFNKIFGYYIDVTKTHSEKVPEYFIKKQTLVNNERYFTEELKQFEDKILNADHQIMSLENKIFNNLCNQLLKDVHNIQFNADIISKIDIFSSLAYLSINNRYVRPIISDGFMLDIKHGRHPVVEELISNDNQFISNDTILNSKEFISIITGPNMAGKSTYLRQIGLIIIMAQIGSFVPAGYAKIGIVDKLFTRVGASDNLAEGESTFLVEMQETANIINNATKNSLILLDEIGRGTSTYDGLSIAWAVTEFIHDSIKAKTLFATHYHELVELANNLKNGNNLNVLVEESSGKSDIVFLRKIVKGGTDKSYGIYVAKMAGLPNQIISKSKIYLELLINKKQNTSLINDKEIKNMINKIDNKETHLYKDFINELSKININGISPIEGLNILNDIIKKYVK
jgi:DNA mismatch repair protein MutS